MKTLCAGIIVALATGSTALAVSVPGDDYCGSPRPGPWWPPLSKELAKSEHVQAGALLKVAGTLAKCYQKGVFQVFKRKASDVAGCVANALRKYDAAVAKVEALLPACAEPAVAGAQVETLVRAFNGVVYCNATSGLQLPAEFHADPQPDPWVPADRAILKTEVAASKLLLQHATGILKCVEKGIASCTAGKPAGFEPCVTKATLEAQARAVKLDFSVPGFGARTGCYEAPTLLGLVDAVTDLVYSFLPGVYCVAP